MKYYDLNPKSEETFENGLKIRSMYKIINTFPTSPDRRVPEAFYKVHTLERVWGYYPLYGARCEALWQKMVLGHFKRQK